MEVPFLCVLGASVGFGFRSFLVRWKMERTATFEPSWRVICEFTMLPAVSSILLPKLTFTKYTGLARVIGGTSHSKCNGRVG